jgi:hypothetical protein
MLNNQPKGFEVFKPIMEKYFVEHFNGIISNIQEIQTKYNQAEIKCNAYGNCNVKPTYDVTIQKLTEKYNMLTNEIAQSNEVSQETTTVFRSMALSYCVSRPEKIGMPPDFWRYLG